MADNEFTNWTALPNGIVGGTARVSIFVTPKLLGDPLARPALRDYPAIASWPKTIAGLQFEVTFAMDDGSTVGPIRAARANLGELAPDPQLWPVVFPEAMRVVPTATEPNAMLDSAASRNVSVYYRSAPLQSLVDETYALHARLALADLDSEPSRPKIVAGTAEFDSPDALLRFARGGADAAITSDQFARENDGAFRHRQATAVTQFFSDERLSSSEHALSRRLGEPLDRAAMKDVYTAFSLYHARGIRNRNHRLRAPRRWRSTDPDFNFLPSTQFRIAAADNGKEFEFAESAIDVFLPDLGASDKGFEVQISYLPDQALPAQSNPDHAERSLRNEDETVDRFDKVLKVATSGSGLFDDGRAFAEVYALRSMRFSWDGSTWTAFDPNELDFHASLSALSSYPSLMRRLGWIFDVEIGVEALPAPFRDGTAARGRIMVAPVLNAGLPDAPRLSSPWTRFSLGDFQGSTGTGLRILSFCPTPDTGRSDEGVVAGFRDLSASRAFQYDLDAAVLKTVHKAIKEVEEVSPHDRHYRLELPGSPRAAIMNDPSKQRRVPEQALDIDPRNRFPAIRSTGISLYIDREYANFGRALKADFARRSGFVEMHTAGLVGGTTSDIFLNDVTVGYAIDVYDESTASWHSLCERQVYFAFEGGRARYLAPADEGWISAEAMSQVDEDGNRQLRNNENLFRWDGWSLVAPNPSKALKEYNNPGGAAPRNIKVGVSVEQRYLSLPKLRFLRRYRFRAKTVDLAGNCWEQVYANVLDTSKFETPWITYRRYDPVNPPFMFPLQAPGPGPSPSNGDKGSQGPEKGEMIAIRSGAGNASASGQWLVLAPEMKFQEAAWSGLFDELKSPDAVFSILEKYCGVLPAQFDASFKSRITWSSGKLATPYLPDAHAAGAAFRYLPGRERKPERVAGADGKARAALEATTTVDFLLNPKAPVKKVPFSQPFILELRSGARRPPKFTGNGRRLTVWLPPGEQQLIRMGSYPTPDLEVFAQFHNAMSADQTKFVVQSRNGAQLGAANWTRLDSLSDVFKKAVLGGLFWPVTPQKNIYLMHAVPKPLVPPPLDPREKKSFRFSDNAAVSPRVTGGTATVLTDPTLRVHRASTGRIDVRAVWTEFSDRAGAPIFPTKEHREQPCFSSDIDLPDLTIAPDETHLMVDFGKRHEFPSTKHYAVRYDMTATTRYREYYSAETVKNSDNITIKSEPSKVLHILNTVPPPAPEVVYVLPIQIWGSPKKNGTRVEREIRRGLRIFMRRGWFASGEDERLAVVLAPATGGTSSGAGDEVPVTEWGTNPIWLTAPLKRRPTTEDFVTDETMAYPRGGRQSNVGIAKAGVSAALAVQRDAAHAAAEDPAPDPRKVDDQIELSAAQTQMVDVAVFEIGVDPRKDMLYADVELKDTESYSPLVQFALARYQHFSAPYAFLSPIKRWVFQALSAKRTISYGPSGVGLEKQIVFALTGNTPGDRKRGFRTNSVEVLLSEGDKPGDGGQLPLVVEEDLLTFSIPAARLAALKKPTVHIQEFEHPNGSDARIAFAVTIDVDKRVFD